MEEGNECGGGRSITHEFDDNILTEILLRLPMKIKVRCKAVCKRWLHLISDPSFVERVLGTPSNHIPWCILYQYDHDNLTCPTDDNLRLLIASERNSDGSNSHTFMQNFLLWNSHKHRVYAAHNGLILCSDRSWWKLYVCNPITGKRVTLPEPQIVSWELIGFIVSCSGGRTGFKVVRVTRHYQNNRWHTSEMSNFEVFSSDVGEWRDTGVSLPETDGFGYDQGFNGVVHDGKLHWRAGTDSKRLIAYDPNKNQCRVFSFNVPLNVRFRTGLIGTSCGHLCYANYATYYGEDVLSVYVLENYEAEEWRPLVMTEMRIVLDLNHINENNRWYSMMPLAFHPSNKDIVYFEVRRHRGGRIVYLNLQTKELISLTGEEIPEGFNVTWPISVYEIPPWPTSVPQQIWDTITSVHEQDLDTISVPESGDDGQESETISVPDYSDDDLFDGFDGLFS